MKFFGLCFFFVCIIFESFKLNFGKTGHVFLCITVFFMCLVKEKCIFVISFFFSEINYLQQQTNVKSKQQQKKTKNLIFLFF